MTHDTGPSSLSHPFTTRQVIRTCKLISEFHLHLYTTHNETSPPRIAFPTAPLSKIRKEGKKTRAVSTILPIALLSTCSIWMASASLSLVASKRRKRRLYYPRCTATVTDGGSLFLVNPDVCSPGDGGPRRRAFRRWSSECIKPKISQHAGNTKLALAQ